MKYWLLKTIIRIHTPTHTNPHYWNHYLFCQRVL